MSLFFVLRPGRGGGGRRRGMRGGGQDQAPFAPGPPYGIRNAVAARRLVRAGFAAARLAVERAAAVAVIGAPLYVVVVGGDATLVDRPKEPVCGGA